MTLLSQILLLIMLFTQDRTQTVPEILSLQDQWQTWINDRKVLVIQGRYAGRAGSLFRLKKLPFSFEAPRSAALPDSLRAEVRMELTGTIRSEPGRIVFSVTRVVLGDTDVDLIKSRASRIDPSQPERLLELAEEFVPMSEFYEDSSLKAEIAVVRQTAFERLRIEAAGDYKKLLEVVSTGREVGIEKRVLTAVEFEAAIAGWKSGSVGLDELRKQIESNWPGWDQADTQNATASVTPENAAAKYAAADDATRMQIHRWIFRQVRRSQILPDLKPSGENGIAIASLIRDQLPEESELADSLEKKEVDFRVARVRELSRLEIQQLSDLLIRFKRDSELSPLLSKWLEAQSLKFRDTGVSGLVRTADEYLFVGDRWSRTQDRQRGIDLLKEAWFAAVKLSPEAASQIEERLKGFGWERLKDQWMTRNQIESLPQDDIQLAVREGRVVRGMSQDQVIGILGQPQRVARLIASRSIRELWIYETQGSSRMVVELQRPKSDTGKGAKVLSVSSGN
ncbi:MAG: hypothetical protein JNL58_17045 [Planctomyces sp.]|nr:hypothetical protein [Planctomyces sp.]